VIVGSHWALAKGPWRLCAAKSSRWLCSCAAARRVLSQLPYLGGVLHGLLRQQMLPFAWPYGSRTKARPFERHGLLGRQTFRLPLSPATRALLHLGMWLGVGEGGSFGCGRYTLHGN
jgi:hypothetical protein